MAQFEAQFAIFSRMLNIHEGNSPSPEMAEGESDYRLSDFLQSGVYRFKDSRFFFFDPVRILNWSYTRFRVSPSAYYSRFFPPTENRDDAARSSRKRKRKHRGEEKIQVRPRNLREQIADQRHQEARQVLLKAHEALLGASQLLEMLGRLRDDGGECHGESTSQENELDLVELGTVWQAPLCEITLKCGEDSGSIENADAESCPQRVCPVFNNLIANEGSNDIEAELLDHKYILPKKSCFYMSDLSQIVNLIPDESDNGFNLIVIDPPWENSSAHQKRKYETLPNRYFLSLPIKQLIHTTGALVALWVTNKEKLRSFVENELFPKWGIEHAATFYWLKVKADGSLIGELDLFHHRPYECLLLGFCHGKETNSALRLNHIPDKQVFISIPGDYSRKPPIGELLLDYCSPGLKRGRCIELFAREMAGGWTCWGNEPLHFQHSRYFTKTAD